MAVKHQMSADEKRWQAEEDARTMARYEEIMSSTTRKNAAIRIAMDQAADLTKRANIMSRVASGNAPAKPKKK